MVEKCVSRSGQGEGEWNLPGDLEEVFPGIGALLGEMGNLFRQENTCCLVNLADQRPGFVAWVGESQLERFTEVLELTYWFDPEGRPLICFGSGQGRKIQEFFGVNFAAGDMREMSACFQAFSSRDPNAPRVPLIFISEERAVVVG
ncbi:hypothetical protein ACFLZP_04075 [Patescibacteria group bacterium]